jgi:DNA repair protein RadC
MSDGIRKNDPSDKELLKALLSYAVKARDAEALSDRLLADFGNLYGVLTAHSEDLADRGLSESAVILLRMMLPLGGRAAESALPPNMLCDTLDKLGDLVTRKFIGASTEHAYLVLLDGDSRLISVRCVSVGVVNTTSLEPRKIVETALFSKAAFAVLAHNHPSGNLEPSQEDEITTGIIADALETVGIPLIEHLIVSGDSFLPMILFSDSLKRVQKDCFYGKEWIRRRNERVNRANREKR